MKLYTRTGDDGNTGLFDGSRVAKDDLRVAAYGDVDELNAQLGVVAATAAQRKDVAAISLLLDRVLAVQSELFSLGAELATPATAKHRQKVPAVLPEHCSRLEQWIDDATEPAPELRAFILPGGDLLAAQLHVCRTVCRRAERAVVTLARKEEINTKVIIYLNRLSDLLFAWARFVNHAVGVMDVPWVNPKKE